MVQSRGHNHPQHSFWVEMAFLLLSCGVLASCGTPQGDRPGRQLSMEAPTWLQGLREPLQELPDADPGSHNQVMSDNRHRVGEPTELGELVSTPPQGLTAALGPEPQTGEERRPLVSVPSQILVTMQSLAPDAEPAAEPASKTPSMLESLYRGDVPLRPDRQLMQFGYDQIERLATSVGAVDGPSSADHVVVTGDELVIDLTTDRVERMRVRVGPDGTIELPGVLSLSVAGMSFADVEARLRSEIGRVRQNFELSLSLGRLASVPIRVVGEVKHPGVIEAGPRPTALDAIGLAGVRRSGSLRRITIIRQGGQREQIDLYDYLLGQGDRPDVRLFRGDTVSVPPIGRTVAIAGSVQRPGIYELLGDPTTVAAAIALAGGSTGFAIIEQIQLERTESGRRVLIDVRPEGFDQELQDGDLLLVGAVDGRLHPIVEVKGEVARPGRFQHRQGMTTGDLVRMAGGLTAAAYDGQAILSRINGAYFERHEVWDAQRTRTSRRVLVIDLRRAMLGDPTHDIPLEPLDLLRVARFDEARDVPTIEIIGAVRRPGSYELTAGMTVSDLIVVAGHLAPDAFREEAELVRRTRTQSATVLDVTRYRIALDEVLSGSSRGPALETGDRLIIRALSRAEVRVRANGLVRFPGEYVLPAGAQITDLIAAAGGVLEDADLRAAVFTRQSVRELQLHRWNDLAERTRQAFERNLQQRVNSARSKEAFSARIQLEQVQDNLDRLRSSQATGRIVLPFTDAHFPESTANLVLEDGDSLSIPRRSNTVTVQGHVFNPTTVVHESSLSADDLLGIAGGPTEIADRERIYVVRSTGRVVSVQQRRGKFRLDEPLFPGDMVLVPPRPLDRDSTSRILDVLLLARTAGEAVALWNLGIGQIDDASLSIIDTPASPRSDSTPPAELLREFQR